MDFAKQLQERTGKGYVSYSALKYAADGSKSQDMNKFELYMTGKLKWTSTALQFGSLYDCMLLEPETLDSRFMRIDDSTILDTLVTSYKNPRSSKPYRDWKAQQEEVASAKGLSVVSVSDWDMSTEMVKRLNSSKVVDQFTGEMVDVSKYLTGTVQHEINAWIEDVPVRGFLDVYSEEGGFVSDSKSSKSLHSFKWDVPGYCYDIQAYIYTQAMGVDDFYWVVQEKTSPYLCGVYRATPRTLGEGKRKFWSAIGNIRQWLDGNDKTESFALFGEI